MPMPLQYHAGRRLVTLGWQAFADNPEAEAMLEDDFAASKASPKIYIQEQQSSTALQSCHKVKKAGTYEKGSGLVLGCV